MKRFPNICNLRVLTFPLECLTVSLAKSGLLRVGLHQLSLRRVGQGCQVWDILELFHYLINLSQKKGE